jgi:mono/diheme cytochrome c family protein
MRNTTLRLEEFMLNFKLAALAAASLFVAASAGYTAETEPGYKADAGHGLDLAKRWCASCHLVSADQQRASADVPAYCRYRAVSELHRIGSHTSYLIRTRKCPNYR